MTDTKKSDIFGLLPLVSAEVTAIGKNQQNKAQGYAFRGIDDVYNAFHEALARHLVTIVPRVEKADRELIMREDGKGYIVSVLLTMSFRFFAPDGSSVEAVTVGEALDYGDKATNKAMSACYKYALLQTFCVPTVDQSVDSERDTIEYPVRQRAQNGSGRVQTHPEGQSAVRQAPSGQKAYTGSGPLQGMSSEAQQKAIYAISKGKGLDVAELVASVTDGRCEHTRDLTKDEASNLISDLNEGVYG